MSDNVPERIWIDKGECGFIEECGGWICNVSPDKMDNSVEWVRKDIADKEIEQVMGDGSGVYIKKQIDEILKPLREAAERYGTANGNSVVYQGLGKAIKETLERADG